MHKLLSTLACTAAMAATLPAQALTLVSISATDGSAAAGVDNAALPVIAADIGFTGLGTASFQFELAPADADATAAFNAVINIAREVPALELTLDRGSFALLGSVTPAFSAVGSMVGGAQWQRISLVPAEPFGIDIGNPFAAAGAENWLIGLAGMQSGDRFTLTVSAVPEPGSWALALAGASVLLMLMRRRQPGGRR